MGGPLRDQPKNKGKWPDSSWFLFHHIEQITIAVLLACLLVKPPVGGMLLKSGIVLSISV